MLHMLMNIEYTKEFAESMGSTIMVWPNAREAVIDLAVTEDDWVSDPRNALAKERHGKRYAYSEEEIRGLWVCVEKARETMMAWFLVKSGKAVALNPALAMVRG